MHTEVYTLVGYDEKTMPQAKEVRVKIFEWLVTDIIKLDTGSTVIDLGSGPCLFAKKYREKGYKVTAVDARIVRKPNDKELTGITFRHEDIRETDLNGFNLISNLGLFYHLTLDDQKLILERTPSGTTTILETQIYEPETVTELGRIKLSVIQRVKEYSGSYYTEGDNPMASWGNEYSFWHTQESLLTLIKNSGFKSTISVYPHFLSKYASRSYYVLKK